jgi:glutamyl-tRNA reductase
VPVRPPGTTVVDGSVGGAQVTPDIFAPAPVPAAAWNTQAAESAGGVLSSFVLLCFSASHHTADFDLLERLERHADAIQAAVHAASVHRALQEGLHTSGAVVLATCNRFEAYLDVPAAAGTAPHAAQPAAEAADRLRATVAAASGIPADDLASASIVLTDTAAAEHLFAVTSGLESLVIGEGEIAGQVRRSLERARSHGGTTRELERLFQTASRVSREVKGGSHVHTAGRSIVRLALELAASRIVDWATARILLVGTGNYAATALKALRERGAQTVAVYSRTGRAQAFALKHGVETVTRDGLASAVAAADLVITCSTAPTVLLDRDLVEEASRHPDAVPHRLIVDLGMPRNVEREVAWVTGTELLDLETIGLHAPLEDFTATERARSLVADAVADYSARGDERDAEPALVELRRHVGSVLDAELERARRRGDSVEEVERALRHFAGVLLHTPSLRGRELARDGEADAFAAGVHAVFGLDVPDSARRPSLRIVADRDGTHGDRS